MQVRVDVVCSAARRTSVRGQQDARVMPDPCAVGDIVLGRVVSLGLHSTIETVDGTERPLRPGEVCAVVIGKRYSTAEFHGDIPGRLSAGDRFDLLNVGGVAGRVLAETSAAAGPTVLAYLGHAVDDRGRKLSTFDDPIRDELPAGLPAVILVIGSSMDSGKTTSAAFIVQMLSGQGFRVGGGKLTGTSRMKDLFRMRSAGAVEALDFLDAGWPSTSGLTSAELVAAHHAIVGRLAPSSDVIVTEVADGILQRETELILASRDIMDAVRMTVACATDSVSAYGMVTYLSQVHRLVPDFISGVITSMPLFVQETSQKLDIPFFVDSEPVRHRLAEMVGRSGNRVQ